MSNAQNWEEPKPWYADFLEVLEDQQLYSATAIIVSGTRRKLFPSSIDRNNLFSAQLHLYRYLTDHSIELTVAGYTDEDTPVFTGAEWKTLKVKIIELGSGHREKPKFWYADFLEALEDQKLYSATAIIKLGTRKKLFPPWVDRHHLFSAQLHLYRYLTDHSAEFTMAVAE